MLRLHRRPRASELNPVKPGTHYGDNYDHDPLTLLPSVCARSFTRLIRTVSPHTTPAVRAHKPNNAGTVDSGAMSQEHHLLPVTPVVHELETVGSTKPPRKDDLPIMKVAERCAYTLRATHVKIDAIAPQPWRGRLPTPRRSTESKVLREAQRTRPRTLVPEGLPKKQYSQ